MRVTLRSLLGSLLIALALAAALPARAGIFDDDEARARIDKLKADIAEVAQKTENLAQKDETLSHAQLDFANQLETLKTDIAKLRGQIEVLMYDLDTAQKRQKDFYVDLDNRLRKFEQQTSLAEQQKASAAADAAAAEMRDYEAALTEFKAAKYKDASLAFQTFIRMYPKSTMQPAAHYWAAASLRQTREFKDAAALFAKVAEQWPDDPKAADALLAQADCQQDAGDAKGAKKTLEALVAKYPSSSAAQSAKPRLKKR